MEFFKCNGSVEKREFLKTHALKAEKNVGVLKITALKASTGRTRDLEDQRTESTENVGFLKINTESPGKGGVFQGNLDSVD